LPPVRRAAIAIVVMMLAGCERPPIAVVPQPPAETAPHPRTDATPACTVRLAEVSDIRIDPASLGTMIGRPVRTSDSMAWFQSALSALKKDDRLRFVEDDRDAPLVLRIALAKAYIMPITTQKIAAVVIRVSYSRNGKDIDTQYLRGAETDANWVNGEDEAIGALQRVLTQAVNALDTDVLAHCRAPG
jgi:hypothetical protein